MEMARSTSTLSRPSPPVVRGDRGRRLQAVRGQRLRARDRPGAGRAQVGGRSWATSWDHYDTIEWITQQPWCDGNVGMVGHLRLRRRAVAGGRPGTPGPQGHLPLRRAALRRPLGFRDQHPGGVIQTMPYHIGLLSARPRKQRHPAGASAGMEAWQKAMKNPDYMMYVNLYNILTLGAEGPDVFF